MAEFPSTFANELNPLMLGELDDPGNEALERLQYAGFEVVAGLRQTDVAEVTVIAKQEGVREFCPKDEGEKRFRDVFTTEEWLKKNGGRAMFQLRTLGRLAGYGWTGIEPCHMLPECETTFAVRLDERQGGKGLATPFTKAIVAGSVALFGAKNIGLETWGSNSRAVSSYLHAGAELVATKDDKRPTLDRELQDEDGKRPDVRLFMQFPRTIEKAL